MVLQTVISDKHGLMEMPNLTASDDGSFTFSGEDNKVYREASLTEGFGSSVAR